MVLPSFDNNSIIGSETKSEGAIINNQIINKLKVSIEEEEGPVEIKLQSLEDAR